MTQLLIANLALAVVLSGEGGSIPGTALLEFQGDASAAMVEGIDAFLMRELAQSPSLRSSYWNRDFSDRDAHEKSVTPNRQRLRHILGGTDPRVPIEALEFVSSTAAPSRIAELEGYTVDLVRWPVFDGVHGEGLLLIPKGQPKARVVLLPDANSIPEQLVFSHSGAEERNLVGHRLAVAGALVVIPTLVDRTDTWSGNAEVGRFTNQPHREWIYRQAFELGRHVIGFEVQKVEAVIDWFAKQENDLPIGVVGHGEGGLLALHAGALDNRIDAVMVSGYFQERQRVWEEPIYRNVFGLLREFGDAEIASMIAPRPLVIENCFVPKIDGPPTAQNGRGGAAPGKLVSPTFESSVREVDRLQALFPKDVAIRPVVQYFGKLQAIDTFGATAGLDAFQASLQLSPAEAASAIADPRQGFNPRPRQKRQVEELVKHAQRLLRRSEYVRRDYWSKAAPSPDSDWREATKPYRKAFWDGVIGSFPAANVPANPRTRKIMDEEKFVGHEVMLDVWPEVFAWGYLLVPKGMKEGERRPVVVCQHGLEGVPMDTVTIDPKDRGFGSYQGFARRLAERGFVVYAPHNPYRGEDKFRVLQRKANPLGKSLFSVILAQHERTLDWLSELPFVDENRIGFYGLSYGGKTAMRVPALLDRYCLSICSADFNEWIRKNSTVEDRHSYMFTGEYEMFEYNLGHSFNYAEMAAMIAPRPFMVERGHKDGVAPDEWVAYEYAKVRRLYADLGIPEQTEIEFFQGPHTINGKGTFTFLHRHLNWPEPMETKVSGRVP